MIGAALATVFVPKPKDVEVVVEDEAIVNKFKRVSVKERAPTQDDGYNFLAYSTKWGNCLASVCLCDGSTSITHWMPLPDEPPDEPSVTIYDMLDDFNETITANADAPKGDPVDTLEVLVEPDLYEQFENVRWTPGIIDPGTTVYFSHDNGDTWEHVGEIA